MSRFVYVAALMLCVGYATAEGQGNAMATVQQLMQGLMKQMNSMSSPDNCAKVCGETCTLEASACVDIPDVMDCAANSAACTARCDTDCGCLGQCQADCGSEADCVGQEPEAMATCTATTTTCLGQCEGQCAANELTQTANSDLQKMSAMLSGMIAQLMGLMGQLSGGQ